MVFVLDRHRKPLMPCTGKRPPVLERGPTVVDKTAPLTIHLKDRMAEKCLLKPLRVKFDPGSKETGMPIVLEGAKGPKVILFGIVVHQAGIKARLGARRALRRNRRQRQRRFQNIGDIYHPLERAGTWPTAGLSHVSTMPWGNGGHPGDETGTYRKGEKPTLERERAADAL